jgi:hypothetical protein
MAKKPDRGALSKPITRKQLAALAFRDSKYLGLLGQEFAESNLHAEKMIGLLLRHNIDPKSPDCWLRLSYALALKHEAGFKIAGKTGPQGGPQGRHGDSYGEDFVGAVEEIRARRGLSSDKAAIEALQAEGRYTRGHVPSLEVRLREARAHAKRENAARPSREAFLREAELVLERSPSKGSGGRKGRRS